jgi:hypothetical protein
MPASKDAKILRDEVIVLRNENKPAPELMRRGSGSGSPLRDTSGLMSANTFNGRSRKSVDKYVPPFQLS